jgi:hypothetical protein
VVLVQKIADNRKAVNADNAASAAKVSAVNVDNAANAVLVQKIADNRKAVNADNAANAAKVIAAAENEANAVLVQKIADNRKAVNEDNAESEADGRNKPVPVLLEFKAVRVRIGADNNAEVLRKAHPADAVLAKCFLSIRTPPKLSVKEPDEAAAVNSVLFLCRCSNCIGIFGFRTESKVLDPAHRLAV